MGDVDDPRPPRDPKQLAAWFAEAVEDEVAKLKKDRGGAQQYEVLSGALVQTRGPRQALYQFIIADGLRLPVEGTGSLKIAGNDYPATVEGQETNRILLLVEFDGAPPANIPRGILQTSDTALLEKLAVTLREIAEGRSRATALASELFHPDAATVGRATIHFGSTKLDRDQQGSMEQACGSSVTFIWGPPGTGKTFVIANLVAVLATAGQRVLVASHTHAAVDQALYATVRTGSELRRGPLCGHQLVREHKLLRVGLTADPKIPDSVQLDKVRDTEAQGIRKEILALEGAVEPLRARAAALEAQLEEWKKLDSLLAQNREACQNVEVVQARRAQCETIMRAAQEQRVLSASVLARARRAWFWRERKVARARVALDEAQAGLEKAARAVTVADQDLEKRRGVARRMQSAAAKQRAACRGLRSVKDLEARSAIVAQELGPIRARLRALNQELNDLSLKLVREARVVFATLTKNYTGPELADQQYDAVVVDEISIALPPLVYLAAARATSRVILVGDFLQLPPIVRSDSDVAAQRLGTDSFRLAGVVEGNSPVEACRVLVQLRSQRRMLPRIADVARHLVYSAAGGLDDHRSVQDRPTPDWLSALPPNPLLIVDTADLHCWCGKQPGSLSRFNLCSASLAVSLASALATRFPRPAPHEARPIGIATPYAAQRRLIAKLTNELDLDAWVLPGTVHTFQGAEADLLIFDCVLDEPYWSARLTTPHWRDEVVRDLNVAVTRARSKFILLGSSEWLNKHAKPGSALGDLWAFLTEKADLVPASDLVQLPVHSAGSADRPAEPAPGHPRKGTAASMEILDERSFYQRFERDLARASRSIFALAPYFGTYRWPRVQPFFAGALARAVEVTVVTPPPSKCDNKPYVEKAIRNLRELGALVVTATGLHGKDVIIDEQIVYTGSLNWSSHRGRVEVMHRIRSPHYANLCLEAFQARHIRAAMGTQRGHVRTCPHCGCPVQVVNQRKQRSWDKQPMKVGCTNKDCEGYLRDLDERPPLAEVPRCQVDGRTKYRRVRRGRGEIWQCPKHPKRCGSFKAVPGDGEPGIGPLFDAP